jgi:penicillin-binding protein-related factor A (putative recombinase)
MSKDGKTPPPKEAEITKQIRDLLDALGVFHYKAWQGMMSKKGVSDIIGCYKGRFFAIEVKRPGRSPTEEQAKFLNQVSRAGGIALTAWCVEHVIVALDLPVEINP